MIKSAKITCGNAPEEHKALSGEFSLLPKNVQKLLKKMGDAHRNQAGDEFAALEQNIERMAIPEESKTRHN